jgi:hypothetical protein
MRNSSTAAQLELQYPTSATSAETSAPSGNIGDTVNPLSSGPITDGSNVAASLKAPDFGSLASIYAITSRLAGRLNAAKISLQEHDALLRERQTLLDKKFAGAINRREANRLEYVRWSLDRIEDAKHGEALDALEAAVARYEQIEDNLSNLKEQLLQAIETGRQKQKRTNVRR